MRGNSSREPDEFAQGLWLGVLLTLFGEALVGIGIGIGHSIWS